MKTSSRILLQQVVINGGRYHNYEVSRLENPPSTLRESISHGDIGYFCGDFTVDLLSDINSAGSGVTDSSSIGTGTDILQEAVLGTFRPLTRQEVMLAFRNSCAEVI